MKYFTTIFILITAFALSACSQKQKAKSNFKMTLGKIVGAAMTGGAYLNAIDKGSSASKIIKLDAENSANIPYGTYDLILVGFAGPAQNNGAIHCGSVLNTSISTTAASFTVTLTEASCSETIYLKTVQELKKGITSYWGTDRYDLSTWGN